MKYQKVKVAEVKEIEVFNENRFYSFEKIRGKVKGILSLTGWDSQAYEVYARDVFSGDKNAKTFQQITGYKSINKLQWQSKDSILHIVLVGDDFKISCEMDTFYVQVGMASSLDEVYQNLFCGDYRIKSNLEDAIIVEATVDTWIRIFLYQLL